MKLNYKNMYKPVKVSVHLNCLRYCCTIILGKKKIHLALGEEEESKLETYFGLLLPQLFDECQVFTVFCSLFTQAPEHL